MSDTLGSRAAGGDLAPGQRASAKVRHRPAWIAFVVLGAIFCLGMGFWQLARYQEASGTVQNLGYTFMWPFLAGFLVYAYLKYIRLEADEADEAAEADTADASGGDDDEVAARPRATRSRRDARPRGSEATEIPADLLPTRPPVTDTRARDEGLAAYNSYLAELARQDRAAADRSQERPTT